MSIDIIFKLSYHTKIIKPSMKAQNIVIADADALIATVNSTDSNNQLAITTLSKLLTIKAKVVFPITAVSEAITSAQRKNSDPRLAQAIVKVATSGAIDIIDVEKNIIFDAANLYYPLASKHNTFFDAIIAAIAIKNDAVAIFSFDKWYQTKGFKLASEL